MSVELSGESLERQGVAQRGSGSPRPRCGWREGVDHRTKDGEGSSGGVGDYDEDGDGRKGDKGGDEVAGLEDAFCRTN